MRHYVSSIDLCNLFFFPLFLLMKLHEINQSKLLFFTIPSNCQEYSSPDETDLRGSAD